MARHGQLEMMKLLVLKVSQGVSADVVARSLVCALENGHEQTAKWIMECCHFNEDMIEECFKCINFTDVPLFEPPLAILKWLSDSLSLPSDPSKVSTGCLFRKAASYGNLSVCQWIHRSFALTPIEARGYHDIAIKSAASNGSCEFCEWYIHEFVPEDEHCILATSLLLVASSNGHLPLCKWLVSRHPIQWKHFHIGSCYHSPSGCSFICFEPTSHS